MKHLLLLLLIGCQTVPCPTDEEKKERCYAFDPTTPFGPPGPATMAFGAVQLLVTLKDLGKTQEQIAAGEKRRTEIREHNERVRDQRLKEHFERQREINAAMRQ